jgi:hypothetical protein
MAHQRVDIGRPPDGERRQLDDLEDRFKVSLVRLALELGQERPLRRSRNERLIGPIIARNTLSNNLSHSVILRMNVIRILNTSLFHHT